MRESRPETSFHVRVDGNMLCCRCRIHPCYRQDSFAHLFASISLDLSWCSRGAWGLGLGRGNRSGQFERGAFARNGGKRKDERLEEIWRVGEVQRRRGLGGGFQRMGG